MKNTLLNLSILFFALTSCKAQEIFPLGSTVLDLPKNNYYVKDTNNVMPDLVGTWVFEDGSKTFELILNLFEMQSDPIQDNAFYDRIHGRYIYRDNVTILAEVLDIDPTLNSDVTLHYDNPSEYSVVIKDVVSGKVKVGKFILTSATTATMELSYSEGIVVGGSLEEWVLPSSFTFVKQ